MDRTAQPLTHAQVAAVQRTAERLQPSLELFSAAFYTKLFELDPTLRTEVPSNIIVQGHKFAKMLSYLTAGLGDAEALGGEVRALGARRCGHEVTDDRCEVVGDVLLWTLETLLGPDYTPQVGASWAAAYSFLAAEMKAGAAGAPPGA